MNREDKDGYVSNIYRAHEMVLETLGFPMMDDIVNTQDQPATPTTSNLTNQLGLLIGTLIVVFITWFLFQGF